MKGTLKFIMMIVTSSILLAGCATNEKDEPTLDSSSLQPSAQQQNQARLQSAVYQ